MFVKNNEITRYIIFQNSLMNHLSDTNSIGFDLVQQEASFSND